MLAMVYCSMSSDILHNFLFRTSVLMLFFRTLGNIEIIRHLQVSFLLSQHFLLNDLHFLNLILYVFSKLLDLFHRLRRCFL